MAHGIESRLPFMDYRLVEWVFGSRPPLIVKGETKAPLRRYLRRRGFDQLAARTDKLGYPTPIGGWMNGEGGTFIQDVIATPSAPAWDVLNPAAVQALLARSQAGDNVATFQIFKVVTAVIWLQQTRDRGRLRTVREPAMTEPSPTS